MYLQLFVLHWRNCPLLSKHPPLFLAPFRTDRHCSPTLTDGPGPIQHCSPLHDFAAPWLPPYVPVILLRAFLVDQGEQLAPLAKAILPQAFSNLVHDCKYFESENHLWKMSSCDQAESVTSHSNKYNRLTHTMHDSLDVYLRRYVSNDIANDDADPIIAIRHRPEKACTPHVECQGLPSLFCGS